VHECQSPIVFLTKVKFHGGTFQLMPVIADLWRSQICRALSVLTLANAGILYTAADLHTSAHNR
jgi:hypothetical protein